MIVCSCNVLSDSEMRIVARTATRRTTSYVYGCLGCRARWTRCSISRRSVVQLAAPYKSPLRNSSPRLYGVLSSIWHRVAGDR